MAEDSETQKVSTEKNSVPSARRESEARAGKVVEAFFAKHLRDTPFSQDTTAWNHLQAGIPVLIGLIADEMEV